MAGAGPLLYPVARTLLRRNIRHKVAAAEFTQAQRACRTLVTRGALNGPAGVQ